MLALKNPHTEMYAPNPDNKKMVEEKVMEYCYRLSHHKNDLFQIYGNLDLLVDPDVSLVEGPDKFVSNQRPYRTPFARFT